MGVVLAALQATSIKNTKSGNVNRSIVMQERRQDCEKILPFPLDSFSPAISV